MKGWKKRTEANTKIRAKRKLIINNAQTILKKRFIRSWSYITLKRKREKLIITNIRERHKELLIKISFQKFKRKYLRLQRYEMLKDTALFKYTQKLLRASFKSLYQFSKTHKLSSILNRKSQHLYWTRLATMGLGLFIKNSIRTKSKADFSIRVNISIILRLININTK